MDARISLIEQLPLLRRLALAYAPSAVREPTLALLALDTRLSAILRAAREPMLAQLRLAWWREQLAMDPATWPTGEPLLAVLRSWSEQRAALIALVNGWEAMTGPARLPPAALSALAEARAGAFAALADLVGAGGERDAAWRLGGNWALADLAAHLSHPDERQAARTLALARDWRRTPLSRRLRPLAVLHGLAARAIHRDEGGGESEGRGEHSPAVVLTAMRIGLLGR